MTGQRFDHYRVVERVGEGGMGTVYRAIDETLGREVAIKLLRPELATRRDIVERFHMEALTLAKLNHSNIATLYGLTRKGTDCFMVMEYVRGETLEQVLKRVGRLPWSVVVRIGRQVLSALAYAHGMQVVHRDIKPSNLMIDAEGRIKVMDFGLARVLGSDRSTRAGHIVGTLEYMAPEQIRGQEVDGRADQYALAIVLYELLAGAIPFKPTSDYALMTAHLEARVPPLRETLSDVPDWLDGAIGVGLAKRPEDRHTSAHVFRDALGSGSAEVEASHMGHVTPSRVVVDDPTDPVPLGFAEAVARHAPATRVAVPQTGMPAPKATRLADAHDATVTSPDAHRHWWPSAFGRWDLRVMGASAIALMLVAIWIGLRSEPSTHASATTQVSAAPPPGAGAVPPSASPPPAAAPVTREPTPSAPPPPPPTAGSADRDVRPPPLQGVLPDVEKRADRLPPVAPEPPPLVSAPTNGLSGVGRYAALAPRTFDKVNMITWDEDEPDEIAVRLTLQADRIVVRDAGSNRVVRSIAYSNIESALYSSKDPQLEAGVGASIGKVFRAPVSLFRGPRHWLTVNTGSEPLFFRLDKQRVDEVLPAFEQHTGIAVTKAGR